MDPMGNWMGQLLQSDLRLFPLNGGHEKARPILGQLWVQTRSRLEEARDCLFPSGFLSGWQFQVPDMYTLEVKDY